MTAATRNMMMAVVLAAFTNPADNWRQCNSRYTTVATKSAYTAATAAFSVEEHTPAYEPTNTITGKYSAQVDSFSACSFSAVDARGGGLMFSRCDTQYQAVAMDSPINKPGTMPARNSLLIDTLAATPNTTNPIDGGMTGAMMPAD